MGLDSLASSFTRESTRTNFKSFRTTEGERPEVTSLEESTDGYAIFPQGASEQGAEIIRAMEYVGAGQELPEWPEWFLAIEAQKGQRMLVLQTARDEIKLLVVDGQLCFAAYRQNVPFLDLTLKKEDPELVTKLVDAFSKRRRLLGEGLAMAILDVSDVGLTRVERNSIRRQLIRVLMKAAEEGAIPRWEEASEISVTNPLRFSVLELIAAERPLIPIDGLAAEYFGMQEDGGDRWIFKRATRIGLAHWISASPMPTVERAQEITDALRAVLVGFGTIAKREAVFWSTNGEQSFVLVIDADYIALTLHEANQGGRALATAVRMMEER